MEKNEVKKLLYKAEPAARLIYVSKERLWYRSDFDHEGTTYLVSSSIPLGDIGDAKFYTDMDAKYLIRWID